MAAPQEVILSTSSLSAYPFKPTASTSTSTGTGSTPINTNPQSTTPSSITLHDLQSSTQIHSFKPTNSLSGNVGVVPSRAGQGGGVFVSQENKALLCFWAWQKDQIQSRIHLPEKLSCFTISPNGLWAAGGSGTGHLYLWEIASGLLLSSFDAHYRTILTLTFSPTSQLLISTSEDSSTFVWSIPRLVDNDPRLINALPEPWAALEGHSLAVICCEVGRGGGLAGVEGRVWTGSMDGTVKIWALNPPALLTTFKLPPSQFPTSITVDPLERSFHVGTQTGEIHHVRLYRRRREIGRREEDEADYGRGEGGGEGGRAGAGGQAGSGGDVMVAVGGGGVGSEDVLVADGEGREKGKGAISLGVPITTLALSGTQDQLVSGTSTGQIHIHALPSHQHLRTINTHSGSAITHLSIIARPPDLVGHLSLGNYAEMGGAGKEDAWPIMDVKPFERMRVGKKEREEQQIGILLGPKKAFDLLDDFDVAVGSGKMGSTFAGVNTAGILTGQEDQQSKVDDLQAEVTRLQDQLRRAKEINDEMWKGVVKRSLDGRRDDDDEQVDQRVRGGGGKALDDVEME